MVDFSDDTKSDGAVAIGSQVLLDFDLVLPRLRSDSDPRIQLLSNPFVALSNANLPKNGLNGAPLIPLLSGYKRPNRVWAFLGGRNCSVNGRCYALYAGSVRVQVYFAHTVMQYGK